MHYFFLLTLWSAVYISQEVKADCGGLIEKYNGTIKSPSYPSRYPANQRCIWEIRVPPSHRIKLYFTHFDLEEGELCKYDNVTIKSRMEDGSLRFQGKFCGSQVIPNITSDSNILLIEFKSDAKEEYTGFELEFFSECGWVIEATNGTITSPLYPSQYPHNQICTWEIKVPPRLLIRLHFRHFNLEGDMSSPGATCKYDTLKVKSKMPDKSVREHGTFCGSELVPNITSDSNILLIQFRSDNSVQRTGFELEFFSDDCGGMIEEDSGHVSSPFFPQPYPSNKICEWSFILQPQHKIKLHFLNFGLEDGGDDCSNDFLLIQSKTDNGDINEYGKYCGVSWPPTIYSKDSLVITFVSDRTFQSKGFKVKYTIDKWTDYELSTSLMKSTTPAYVVHISATAQQGENTEIENATSTTETNILSDIFAAEFESTLSSEIASTPSAIGQYDFTFANQQEEAENWMILKNETDILSDNFESTLSSKIASTPSAIGQSDLTSENQQEEVESWMILKNGTDILSDAVRLLTEKVGFMEDNQKMLLKNNEDKLKNEFESAVLPAVASTISAYESNGSITEGQQSEVENWIVLRNETNILLDAVRLLTEKVASIEDNQKALLKSNENVLKIGRLLTSKNALLQDEGKTSSSLVQRRLFNDCGKFIFFLRRMLDAEP